MSTVMNSREVEDYIKTYFPQYKNQEMKVTEIGDGNINYVFKIEVENQSLVLKQADHLLRSSGRPLDKRRIEIEGEYLLKAKEYSPGTVPEIYIFDKKNSLIVMEDISQYKNMRKVLQDGIIYRDVGGWIIDFLVPILSSTSTIKMDRKERKDLVAFFQNPDMCDISENLVLTEPYIDYRGTNRFYPGTEDLKKLLYEDRKLKIEVDRLKDKFMSSSQCLIHGDLHSGSIFVCEKGIKVIDSEFAIVGPGGYDIGNVLAHFIISIVTNFYSKNKDLEFIDELIEISVDFYTDIFIKLENSLISNANYFDRDYIIEYIEEMRVDTLGYMGTEIIRRVVGDTKTEEIESIEGKNRILCDKELVKFGIDSIKGNIEDLKTRINQVIEC